MLWFVMIHCTSLCHIIQMMCDPPEPGIIWMTFCGLHIYLSYQNDQKGSENIIYSKLIRLAVHRTQKTQLKIQY